MLKYKQISTKMKKREKKNRLPHELITLNLVADEKKLPIIRGNSNELNITLLNLTPLNLI